MKKFVQRWWKYWPVISLILLTILYFTKSLTLFQVLILLVLTQISVQIESLLTYQEVKRQYNEFLVRAAQRKD